MIVKKHFTSDRKLILAICDDNLLGKKIEEGNKILDLTSDYYKGDIIEPEELLLLLKSAYLLNIVGENSVEFIKQQDLISDDKIMFVDNVPHVQLLIVIE